MEQVKTPVLISREQRLHLRNSLLFICYSPLYRKKVIARSSCLINVYSSKGYQGVEDIAIKMSQPKKANWKISKILKSLTYHETTLSSCKSKNLSLRGTITCGIVTFISIDPFFGLNVHTVGNEEGNFLENYVKYLVNIGNTRSHEPQGKSPLTAEEQAVRVMAASNLTGSQLAL